MKHTTLTIVGLAIVALLLSPSSAAAANPLEVQFENTPLFSASNIVPGDSVTRWVKITNNTDATQTIATEAFNVVDTDGFGSALMFSIARNGTDLYGGTTGTKTLADFFSDGEVTLTTIPSGQTVQYDYTVTFPKSETAYQGKTLQFDIAVGFQGQGELEAGVTTNTPTGGGGGGGTEPHVLVISNEANLFVSNVTATITWTTNFPATSQVVYGAENEAHTLNLNDTAETPPLYGYAHTTPEFDTLPHTTSHSITLAGLLPDTTYYYRVISHASPASISTEHSFHTAASSQQIQTEDTNSNTNTQTPNSTSLSTQHVAYVPGSEQAGTNPPEQSPALNQGNDFGSSEPAPSPSSSPSASLSPLFAGPAGAIVNPFLADILGNIPLPLQILLVLIILGLVLWLILTNRHKKSGKPQIDL